MPLNDAKSGTSSQSENPFDLLLEKAQFIDEASAKDLDLSFRAALAKLTRGMSPLELVNAYVDWIGHLAISPGKQLLLLQSLIEKLLLLGKFGVDASTRQSDANNIYQDRNFAKEEWQTWPFNLLSQAFLAARQLTSEASHKVSGVKQDHEELVAFLNTQVLEAISPANFPFTNPEVIETTKAEQGENIVLGIRRLIDDISNKNAEKPASAYKLGVDVACSPGKVVYQNDLIELIQYAPSTPEVRANPVLIVPPWIMKFYILDLTPDISLIKYLVDQGKTVFLVSWKNPTAEDRDRSMDNYLDLGIVETIKAVRSIVPRSKVNTVGYCIGGTLLSIAAAALAKDGDDSICSVSLFTAQTDFTDPGEIKRMLGESQISFLESLMWKQGYLEATNMGDAFKAMKPADLIWGPTVHRYFLGKDIQQNELMAWSSDVTRMPYRMHSEYLHQLYMNNDLATGEYKVHGQPISLADIRVPIFSVATTTDHIAPWQSVYKILRLTHTPVTFLLTNGGHNTGIVCGEKHPRRAYQVHLHQPGDSFMDPETWLKQVEINKGSWWLEWNDWLDAHSGNTVKPPKTGAPRKGYKVLRDAPGEYVVAP